MQTSKFNTVFYTEVSVNSYESTAEGANDSACWSRGQTPRSLLGF